MQPHVPVNQGTASPKFLRSLNGDGHFGFALLLAIGLLLLPLLGGDRLRLAWRYQRDAIADGEIWRTLTAHIVHLDAGHALLNALGLVLLWGLFARTWNARQWLFAIAMSLLAIDLDSGSSRHNCNGTWAPPVCCTACLHAGASRCCVNGTGLALLQPSSSLQSSAGNTGWDRCHLNRAGRWSRSLTVWCDRRIHFGTV